MSSLIELSLIRDIHGTVPKPSVILPNIIRQKNKITKIQLFARLLYYRMKTNEIVLKVEMSEPDFHIEIPIDCKLLYQCRKNEKPLVLHNIDGFLHGKVNGKIEFVSMSSFDKKILIKITDSLYTNFFVEVSIPIQQVKLWTRKWVQMSLLSDIPC